MIAGAGSVGTMAGAQAPSATVDPVPFAVHFGEHVIAQPIMAVTVMPGEEVAVSVERRTSGGMYRIQSPTDSTTWAPGDPPFTFTAPDEPDLYPLVIRDTEGPHAIQLQVFVLEPWDHSGQRLENYRIGRYQKEARRGLETYERPEGFIRVTEETKYAQVAPNFRLEQFLCKQTTALPQYVLVQTPLLQLLEEILAAVQARGHDVSTLHVMSAFRTPFYNRSIGNTSIYSRHLYGDAADIFVDESGNGRMDDLTGSGRVTRADAQLLADIVAEVKQTNGNNYEGGIGVYGPAPHRGPFVHVDLRGYQARW